MYSMMSENKEMCYGVPNLPSTAPPQTISVSPFVVKPLVGPSRTVLQCPFCLQKVTTLTDVTTTTRTHSLALKCCFMCCCCLPYCMNSTKNIDHFCPSCKGFLGTYIK